MDEAAGWELKQNVLGLPPEIVTAISENSAVAAPTVSVILTCFNNRRFIGGTVRSVLKQTLQDFELIIVDDASTDGSVAQLRAFAAADPRIRLITFPERIGFSASYKYALGVARGVWVAIVDADDLLYRGRLEQLVARAEQENIDLIADNQMLFDDAAPGSPSMLLGWNESRRLSLADLIRGTAPDRRSRSLASLKPLIRTEFLRRTGLHYRPASSDAGNGDFLMRLIAENGGSMLVVAEPWYLHRKSGTFRERPSREQLTSVQAGLLDFERHYGSKLDANASRACRGAVQDYEAATRYDELASSLKQRDILAAAGAALKSHAVDRLLRTALRAGLGWAAVARHRPSSTDRFRSPDTSRPQVCLLSRQRVIGRTNGSSVYLLGIVQALHDAGCDVHLVSPSPAMFGRWPWVRLLPDMEVFSSIQVRRSVRLGSVLIAVDPRPWVGAARGLLGRVLSRAGIRVPSLLEPAPYNVAVPWRHADRLFVAAHRPSKVDAVLCDYAFLADGAHCTLNPEAPVAIVQHDLFHTWAAQFSDENYQHHSGLVDAKTEWSLLALADAVISIQDKEASAVRAALPDQRVIVAPVAANTVPAAQPGKCGTLLFVGSNTTPNGIGLDWLVKEVWPLIRDKDPDAELLIAGSVCKRLPAAPEGVRLLGLVPDLKPLYAEAGVVVSPLQVGSGLKVKLIEAMAAGKAVVATPVTMQGVEELAGDAVLVESDPQVFAATVLSLLRDSDRRTALAARALAVAESRFSAKACYSETVSFLMRTAQPVPPATSH